MRRTFKRFDQLGFTMVELLVVVAIVGMLAAIGFSYYAKQIVVSRDANRVKTLVGIWSQLEVIKGKEGAYPKPDSSVRLVGSGTTTAGYQGVIGTQLMNKLTIVDGKVDAKTGNYFTYLQNVSGQKAEVLGFFEESGNENELSSSLFQNTYAANYTKFYPAAIGHKIGVILNRTTYEPLNETTTTDTVLTTLANANTHSVYGSCLTGGSTSLIALNSGQATNYTACFSSTAPALPSSW